jgi:hypothetical protein
MSSDAELAQLVGRKADSRLLDQVDELLPQTVGRPAAIPPDPAHERLVALGVTMTATTLIGGIVLMLIGLAAIIAGGGDAGVAALALGALLAGTHWGWVHIAEMTGNRQSARRNAPVIEERTHWLEQIEPYTRWTVATDVRDDGSIEIQRIVHEPVTLGDDRFTFVRAIEARELHSGDEPGAVVAERAEQMRQEAGMRTEHERRRFLLVADAHQETLMRTDDEAERRAAVRAASQALSDRINENLDDPPLSDE